MGFDFGLSTQASSKACIRKFRWLLKIDNVSARGASCLPPSRSSRPSISFKETEINHINETIYFPTKPDWKPISLVLYDLQRDEHPVFAWLKSIYNVTERTANWSPIVDSNFLKTADLVMLDSIGNTIESWVYENVYPQSIEFGELDMGSSDIMTCNLTLRYARAYIVSNLPNSNLP